MLIPLAIVVFIAIAALLGFAALKPDTMHVERTRSIASPPDRIFNLIQDFHEWGKWSPYDALDPAMKKTYSGASSGKGAVYEWSGNNKAGAGRMEIVEVFPAARVRIKLDFSRPFEGHNKTEFILEPSRGETKVVWAMDGGQPFLFKVMSIFVNTDHMIGKEFEKGLENLKAFAEQRDAVKVAGSN